MADIINMVHLKSHPLFNLWQSTRAPRYPQLQLKKCLKFYQTLEQNWLTYCLKIFKFRLSTVSGEYILNPGWIMPKEYWRIYAKSEIQGLKGVELLMPFQILRLCGKDFVYCLDSTTVQWMTCKELSYFSWLVQFITFNKFIQ